MKSENFSAIKLNNQKIYKDKKLSLIRKITWILLLLAYGISYFLKSDFKIFSSIDPSLFNQPVQTEAGNHAPIEFEKDGYQYILTPRFNYSISGLVAEKTNYTLFSLHKSDTVFPSDLCMIWGENLQNKSYQDKSLTFRQDSRFCWTSWSGKSNFNFSEVSNNHLLVNNSQIERAIKNISKGDQVRISGQLVDAEIKNIDGDVGKYDFSQANWKTSTTRSDEGAGACEVILVDKVEIIKHAHPLISYINQLILYFILAWVSWSIISFFRSAS